MVYIATSAEWQRQSSLLLQARPATTRITVKYKIPNLDSPKYQPSRKRKRTDPAAGDAASETATQRVPQAVLVLKSFDTASGVVLKFKTDRAADVGRLINGVGRLGRHMAALPEKNEVAEITMQDAPVTTSEGAPLEDGAATKQTQATTGGANKKKKKGKK